MSQRTCLAIVLAAGEGTRMRSSMPKVLHAIGNRTLLSHVLTTAVRAGGAEIAVVVGPNADAVAAEAKRIAQNAGVCEQRERLGTAHALLSARAALARKPDDVLVVFADTPLVQAETFSRFRDALPPGAPVAVL